MPTTTTPAHARPPGWDRVIYIAAHQDDETLSMGSGIVEHLSSATVSEVIVICATDGSATRARHTLSDRLGREVTREQITYYRDAEMRWAVQTGLGARFVIPPPGVRMVDGQATLAGTRALLDWALSQWPGARVKTHSPWEDHNDHRVLGVAATDMHFEGLIPDLRLYLSQTVYRKNYKPDTPRLSTVRRTAAVDAQGAYCLWAPPKPGSSRDDRYFQVGYTSAGPSFRHHASDPASRRHVPVALPAHRREGLR